MIFIDFYDVNGKFVVRHSVEMVTMRRYPFLWAKTYCKAIFHWYDTASFAGVTINGKTRVFERYEKCK